jgi:hypothetical protein
MQQSCVAVLITTIMSMHGCLIGIFTIDKRYTPIKALGRGSSGVVVSAQDTITGTFLLCPFIV